ncbi:hypothetical protein BC351_26555 [Paenibacillus ferrarius]|uniref:Uncharacterized protein n=1 Tax=Paenibacillus ferrarius TaxID=1469647 RepID=A0A1V4HJT0_9BACL|nr:hypothetical protein [Paenibacillus ferrarius]OPH56974.1 hypothetical protein BC351_26555 [Paenibacillus ferrarius]
MGKVSAVIKDTYFKQPSWLSNVEYRETNYLSRSSTPEDAILFFTLLCGCNNIDTDREPTEVLNELIAIDEIAISGGIAFEDEGKAILPSCCCGLENWREVLEAVLSKKDVWLGHDPFPTLEYINDSVRVWSDDYFGTMRKDLSQQELQKMYYIEYNRNDLINKLEAIEMDLLEFFKYSFEKVLCMFDDDQKEMLFLKYCKWFNLVVS